MGKIRTTILSALTLLLTAGCSSDEPSNAAETRSAITIKTRAPQSGTADNELIKSWWLAFVDAEGTVRQVVERQADRTEAVDYEEIEFDIPRGTYTVYAFANIRRESLGIDFVPGQKAPAIEQSTWTRCGAIGEAVPMTGLLRNAVFKGIASDRHAIEVVRLWAKVSFEFTSGQSTPVRVKKISMTPAQTSKVRLMPDYSTAGKAPSLPDDAVCTRLEHTADLSVDRDNEATESFYVLESTAKDHPTGHYPIAFDLEYADGTKRSVNALAYQLAHINRNDHIVIPVRLTDWLVGLDVQFYPPIGGYPAVLLETKGDEYYARFGSSGLFTIVPTVKDLHSGAPLTPDECSVNASVDSGADIFSQVPAASNGEITGELADGKTGTAILTLTFTIDNGALQQTITRKLYIIRE